jgi:hypothetical protein
MRDVSVTLFPSMDASQNRREFKFVLRPGLVDTLRDEVKIHLAADSHSSDGYPVLSEYFDSAERSSYWQKQFGVPNRRRVRGRLYGRSDGSIPPSAFIEVKHKNDGNTVKRRVSCDIEDLPHFSGGNIPDHIETSGRIDERVIDELEDLVVTQGNRPVVQIRYHRYAYDSGPQGTIRITFDLDPHCRFLLKPLRPNCPDFDLPLLDEGAAIMEVKTIGPVPYWFRRLVGRHNLVPRSFSKYAAALEKYEFNHSTHDS